MRSSDRIFSCFRWLLLLWVAQLALSSAVHAQTQAFTATLSGVITDASGAMLNGAVVTLTNPERGLARSFTVNSSGSYSFPLLLPGNYGLKVQAPGFEIYIQQGISLAAGQSATQDISLKLSSVQQQVVVTSEAPLLNTANANISADISRKQVVELPLNLRNVYGLALLNSSVNNSSEQQVVGGNGVSGQADQDVSFFNFGGDFMGSSSFLLDGTWDTGADWGGVIYVPSVDNVQEFKIQTNTFSAQYGWSSGNIVNVVTNSGTSQLHGDAYEFYRNSALDANNYFNNRNGIRRPDFNRNQFGATLGGPLWIPRIYRQTTKTFFFGAYEGLRQSTPLTYTATVPTQAFRSGDLSALLGGVIGTDALGRTIMSGAVYDPYSTRAITAGKVDPVTGLTATRSGYIRDPLRNNNLSGRIDAVAKNMIGYWPNPINGNIANNFTASASAPAHSDEYSIRIDHNFSPTTNLYARWSQKFQTKTNEPEYWGKDNPAGTGVVSPNNRYSMVVGFNHVFTQTFLMSANFGFNRWVEGSQVQPYGFQPSKLGLPTFMDSISPLFPVVNPSGTSPLGPSFQDEYHVPRNAGTASVDFTKQWGRHSLTFGFMGVLNQLLGGHAYTSRFNFPVSMTAGPDPTTPTNGTGYGFASFLLGAGDSSGSTGINSLSATTKYYSGEYLQDDWKITSKLTLNLGLRYEVQTAPTERNNKQAYFDYSATNPISSSVGVQTKGQLVFNGEGNRRGLYETNYTNFAPRIGISYQAQPGFVVRTGYGVFFPSSWMDVGPSQGFSQATPYVGSVDGIHVTNPLASPFPSGIVAPVGRSLGGMQNVGLDVTAVNRKRPSTYVQHWMLGIQYSLRTNDMLDINYIGNHGIHLMTAGMQRNQLNPSYLSIGDGLLDKVANPFYGHLPQSSSGCGLDQTTVTRGQLLRPYPQYCSVNDQEAPIGFSNYNALQVSYNHRFQGGLNVLASYTWSKFIDNVDGFVSWALIGSGPIRNFYDVNRERSVDGNDIPHSFVINYIYELPIGRGKHFGHSWRHGVDAVLGNWQVSGISSFKSGIPLSIVAANNNTGSMGGNQYPNVIKSPKLSHRTLDQWFDTTAFAQPAAYTFGNAPRFFSDLRSPGYQNWDLAVQKWWRFGERYRVQFRGEMYNAFNHTNFYAPNQSFGNTAVFGKITSAYAPRDVQFGGKFYW